MSEEIRLKVGEKLEVEGKVTILGCGSHAEGTDPPCQTVTVLVEEKKKKPAKKETK